MNLYYTVGVWSGNLDLEAVFHGADASGRSSAAIGTLEASPDALESSGSLFSHQCYEML